MDKLKIIVTYPDLFVRWLRFHISEHNRKEEIENSAIRIAKVLGIPVHSTSYQYLVNDLENGVISEAQIIYKK